MLRALGGEVLEPPPFWLMRQAGRYLPEYRELRQGAANFLDFCLTPARAAEATLQPIRRFGMDGAILFSDILVVPHGLGRVVGFRDGEGPVLEPLRTREEAEALRCDGLVERLRPVYETVERVAAVLPAETALIGFAGGAVDRRDLHGRRRASRDFPRETLGARRPRRVRAADRSAGRGDDRASLGADRGGRRCRADFRELGRGARCRRVPPLGDRADAARLSRRCERAIRRCR